MPENLLGMIQDRMDELETEIEKIQVMERVPLLFIQQRYKKAITDFARFCSNPPHESEFSIGVLRESLDKMMQKFNGIASEVGPLIAEIREKASKTGTELLNKVLNSIGSIVNHCITELINVTKGLDKDIGIQGYSVGIGVGGFFTFAINYAIVK